MVDGRWSMDDGRWTMDDGRPTTGHWSPGCRRGVGVDYVEAGVGFHEWLALALYIEDEQPAPAHVEVDGKCVYPRLPCHGLRDAGGLYVGVGGHERIDGDLGVLDGLVRPVEQSNSEVH